MAHAVEPAAGAIIAIEAYRLKARMRKTSDDSVPTVKRVGQELREERERQGKQLDDVWHALKIRPGHLAAIEEGRFGDLPGRAFTAGYVGRYARYLQLDVGKLQERLEAEIAARDGAFNHRIHVEPLPDRKFPLLGIAVIGLLVAALLYSREDIVGFATRLYAQVTEERLAQNPADPPVAALVEQQTEVAALDDLIALPFEVAMTQPTSLRPELLPPLPVIAVTQALAVRPELLPPLPVIAVTQALSVRPEFLPPLPVIAVTQALAVRPEFLPPLPVIAVTQALAVRPEFLPPLPVIAVTQALSVRPEFLPPLPVIAVTQALSVRPEFLPPLPVIAVTQALSVRPEFLPPLPVIAVTQALSVRPEFLPPLPVIAVTQALAVRPEFLPPLPVIAVTQALSVRPQFLPPLPVIAVTQALAVRPEFLPPLPQIAVTRPVSLRADLTPAVIRRSIRAAPQFLPMPLPTRVAVSPPMSLRAELLPQRVQAQLPAGRGYGLQNRNSRITLRVHSPTIVAIRDGRNRVFIDRRLAPGDTYRVPNRAGLWLTAIDAGAVEILLDGASVGFAGAQGAAVRDLSLNPQSIANPARRRQ